MLSLSVIASLAFAASLLSVVINLIHQIFFPQKNEPPVVFHWIPFIGSTITYGRDPYRFFSSCRAKYGDVFTFILLGRKTTVHLGVSGNDFILNGKEKDMNAEDVYGPLCNPVFGSDVVYDCPNSKLMEQKKFIKFGLTQKALVSQVQLIEEEVLAYIATSPHFHGSAGTVNIAAAMSEITIFTASRALQGDEVRSKLTSEFADLYHDLEKGFSPINFMLPWAPLPHNKKRDAAHIKMREVYMKIIRERRENAKESENDMIWNLMHSTYKNGTPMPDKEVAHIMITLLMAGQHSSANVGCWIVLHLANEPDMLEELYQEQLRCLQPTGTLPPLQYDDLDKLPLHEGVVKETLRIHNSIHSIMRKTTNALPIPNSPFVVPRNRILLASPGVTANSEQHFPEAKKWNPRRWTNKTEEQESDPIDEGGERISKGARSPYLPFGAGRHRCIGERFAYINLVVIIANLVRHFKFSNPKGRDDVPSTDYSTLFSAPMQPVDLLWERRKSKSG